MQQTTILNELIVVNIVNAILSTWKQHGEDGTFI